MGEIDSPLRKSELDDLAQQVAAMIVEGLGTRSRWALRTALDARGTEGIAGVAVIKIPAKTQEYLDITFTIGDVELVSRWSGA